MKILAIDTSSKICSVAILENSNIIDEINLDNGKTHSENLMPIIQNIILKNLLKLSDIDLIACSVGPGSFTGIRIGIASVKAMAEAKNIPIASVTSLETLAKIDNSENIKVSLIDAKNSQVYCGIFDKNFCQIHDFVADDIYNVIKILKNYDNIICIGDGAIVNKDVIKQNIEHVKFSNQNNQSAFLVGLIGYQKYLKNDLKNADTICPVYLRKSQAERMKEKK